MSRPLVVIRGLDELDRTLQEIARDIQKDFDAKVLMEAAEIIVERAKDLAPVHTGRLRDSMAAEASESRSGKPTVKIGPAKRKKAWYAAMVEFGTLRIRARPFLRPALRETRNQVNQLLARTIGQKIRSRTRGKIKRAA